MWVEIFILLTVVVATFIQVTTGFGISIIMMTVLPLILPIPESSFFLCFAGIIATSYMAFKYRRSINFKSLIIPLILAVIGSYLGVTVLLMLDHSAALKILGALLILLAVYFYKFSNKIKLPPNILTASLTGICSGLMNGFFNMGGPPIVLYYSATAKNKEEYSATIQFFFAVMIVFKIMILGLKNGVPTMVLSHIPLVAVGGIAGIIMGFFLFKRLSVGTIKKMIYVIMTIAGIWYIVKP